MVSDVYFPRINGVSTSIQTFRQELIRLGHHVTLVAPEYPHEFVDDKDTIRIPSSYLVFDPEDRIMHYKKIIRLKQQFIDQKFDVVHIQTPFIAHYAGLRLAKELGIPVVESYHTFFEEYLFHYIPFMPKSFWRFVARHFTRSQCNKVDVTIVPSDPLHNVMQQYGVESHLQIIPTGMQMDRFKKGNGETFRNMHKIPMDRPTLVHVGRIAHEKNTGFLLKVLVKVKQTIPNVLMIIAGEGPALKHIKKLSEQLGLQENVLFVGYLPRESTLLDCYKAGDAFVFASKTETQGLVLLEAMALGTPVVSTAYMGTKDILKAGKGALVAEDDLDDFAAKAISILSDKKLRKKLSAQAVTYADTWSASAMAKKMVELYKQVAK